MDFLSTFLVSEIYDGAYEEIVKFIMHFDIRNGEYEGNCHIIKKIDRVNFIIYDEYTDKNGQNSEIHTAIAVYKKTLLDAVQNEAKRKGLNLISIID